MSTSDKIREAAVKLFANEGISHVTMRRVAAVVGVSAPALYRHFPSKDHLLLHVVKSGFDIFLQHLMQALQGKTAWERMQISGEQYYQFAIRHPDYYKLMFLSEWTPEDPAVLEHMDTHASISFQFLVDRVRELMDEGFVKGFTDPVSVAFTVWSVVHGTVSLSICGVMPGKGVNVKWQFDQALTGLWAGLGSEKFLAEYEIVRHKSYTEPLKK